MRLLAAIKMNQTPSGLRVGDQVTVDGMLGRGVVEKVSGSRVTIRYRNGEWISRDQKFVHSLKSNMYKSDYLSLKAFKDEGKLRFQGLDINVEQARGSVRTGKDKHGKPWETRMRYPYGEIKDSVGLDGDPVDVYVGDDPGAKFAYVIHQLKPDSGEWDEDKCMLGFPDAMEAKKAYMIHYDEPEKFFGSLDAVPMKRFKELIRKKEPIKIAGALVNVEREGGPVRPNKTGSFIEKVGTQFCVRSTNEQDANFGCYPSMGEARKYMGTLQGKGGASHGGGPGLADMGIRTPKSTLGNYRPHLHDGITEREEPRVQKNSKSSKYHKKFRKDVTKDKYDKRKKEVEEEVDAESQYGTTGWQYGRRQMAPETGYVPARSMGGFPGGGRGGTGARGARITSPSLPRAGSRPAARVSRPTLSSYADYGEPMTGNMGHAHIEPVTWFHPPSLTKRLPNEETRIPADNPREKNDKFLDVTKRNSKETVEQKMKLLKRSTPAGSIPARTTLLEPHSAVYTPGAMMYSSAARRTRRIRAAQGRMFTSYERRGVL